MLAVSAHSTLQWQRNSETASNGREENASTFVWNDLSGREGVTL